MQQLDLFPKSAFSITPEAGRNEPRLWIRRVVIWSKPGEILRSVYLRPGFNIVWSPDSSGEEDASIGHGGGKTTFCRLLRYCLGEEAYAADAQRQRLSAKYPMAHVGAEIILNGEVWVVIRALADRRRDIAIKGGTFEEAFAETATPTGMRPFREAVTGAIIGEASVLMPVEQTSAWGAALAWVSRDQECRFGHALEWRHPETGSRSPVGRSIDDRLVIVRALIGALFGDEIVIRRMEEGEDAGQRTLKTELERLDWQIQRARRGLLAALGDDVGVCVGTELDVTACKVAAAARLAKALKLPDNITQTDVERTRADFKKENKRLGQLSNDLTRTEARIEEKEKILGILRAGLPEAHAQYTKEKIAVCPICRAPIDKVKAEGCGILLKACDIDALRARIDNTEQAIKREGDEIAALVDKQPKLKADIALVEQRLSALDEAVRKLEAAQSARSNEVRKARQLVDDAERYKMLTDERASVEKSFKKAESQLARMRARLAEHRTAASATIRTLSSRFAAVLKELVPGKIDGEIKLDGNGLAFRVDIGGERSTAAIDSLKVIAFDLSVLAMTIEGLTKLPGFLVHDSPREADLGRSIYDRLFRFAKMLESAGPAPLFQYIMTTTTAPPPDFQGAPWLRLEIRGAPADERLLKADL